MVISYSSFFLLLVSRTLRLADTTRSLRDQGIDLEAGGRNKRTKRTAPKSDDVYLKLLVKVSSPSIPCHHVISLTAQATQIPFCS
jgi:hypothetical protein